MEHCRNAVVHYTSFVGSLSAVRRCSLKGSSRALGVAVGEVRSFALVRLLGGCGQSYSSLPHLESELNSSAKSKQVDGDVFRRSQKQDEIRQQLVVADRIVLPIAGIESIDRRNCPKLPRGPHRRRCETAGACCRYVAMTVAAVESDARLS